MNSLSYISRRLDVLVAPAPKPADAAPPPDDTRTGHAWLAHAVDAVVPDARAPPMRRVASSPAGLNLLLSLPSLRPAVAAPRAVSAPTPVDPATSVLRRVFFVRVLVLVWKGLWDTWAAWSGQPAPALPAPTKPTSPDTGGESTDEKESEDEDSERLSLLSRTPPPAPAILLTPPATATHEKPPRVRAPAIERTTSAPSPPATPPPARKLPPFHQPKTLVLDLDETLIHSTTRPMAHLAYAGSGLLGLIGLGSKNKGSGLVVEVVLNGRSTVYHVYKRPFVDYFLRKVSGWYTLVIFTASMREYADPIIDWLDAGSGVLNRRLFRESCTQVNGQYAKDVSMVEQDLSRVCLLDNSPVCYSLNEANGIPIEGWTHDPLDEALLDLLPVLDSLRFTNDVRRVLGIRGFA